MTMRLRPRSVYDVLAVVAFLVAVAGGSAYAAATIGSGDIKNDAVLSRHIKDGQVKASDLAPSSIGSGKVFDGSLLAQDVKPGQLPTGGASSFDQHVDTGATSLATVDGIVVQFDCVDTTPPGPGLGVEFSATTSSRDVYVIGTQAFEGALAPSRFAGPRFVFNSSSGLDMDLNVMVRFNPGGAWTKFQLAGDRTTNTADGCQFGGLISRPH